MCVKRGRCGGCGGSFARRVANIDSSPTLLFMSMCVCVEDLKWRCWLLLSQRDTHTFYPKIEKQNKKMLPRYILGYYLFCFVCFCFQLSKIVDRVIKITKFGARHPSFYKVDDVMTSTELDIAPSSSETYVLLLNSHST